MFLQANVLASNWQQAFVYKQKSSQANMPKQSEQAFVSQANIPSPSEQADVKIAKTRAPFAFASFYRFCGSSRPMLEGMESNLETCLWTTTNFSHGAATMEETIAQIRDQPVSRFDPIPSNISLLAPKMR